MRCKRQSWAIWLSMLAPVTASVVIGRFDDGMNSAWEVCLAQWLLLTNAADKRIDSASSIVPPSTQSSYESAKPATVGTTGSAGVTPTSGSQAATPSSARLSSQVARTSAAADSSATSQVLTTGSTQNSALSVTQIATSAASAANATTTGHRIGNLTSENDPGKCHKSSGKGAEGVHNVICDPAAGQKINFSKSFDGRSLPYVHSGYIQTFFSSS